MTVVGVDTVAVSFRLRGSAEPTRVSLPAGGSLSVSHQFAYVEASLPNRQTGSNVVALDPSCVMPAVAELVESACAYVEPERDGTRPENLRLSRVDVVRDFADVESVGPLLDALRAPRLYAAALPWRYSGESLVIGPKRAWRTSLYDKHLESGGEARPGHLRFELQLRAHRLRSKWALSHGGIMRVAADLDGDKLERLAKASFTLVGYDREVYGRYALADAVWSIPDLSGTARCTLLGWLLATAAEHKPVLSVRSRQKYNALARRHGLAVDLGDGPTRRLDWSTGSELLLTPTEKCTI